MSTPSTLIAGRYRLVKMLGAGGMGVVWQAWDERLERPVALKMLRTQPELTERDRDIATDRAMREARINAGLQHRHAVTVFDVVEHEGQPCLVMQLVESTPLSILLREHGTLTPNEVARIGAQVSSALAEAHKMRIVHRDVKPGNILITDDGSAMISDFGISYALGDPTITATGIIHGTPAYLAPEVAQGRPSNFASDVFSLGSTMYTMLEGDPPFGADKNAIALLHRVARGGYPRPKRAGALAPLLREMLSADPKRRPAMTEVAAALSQIEKAGPAVLAAPNAPIASVPEPAVPVTPVDDPAAPASSAGDVATASTEPLTGPTTEKIPVDADVNADAGAHADAHSDAIPSRTPATAQTIPHPQSIDTAVIREASTGKTFPMDQPTRFEPPTAETEPLRGAAPRSPLPRGTPPRPPVPADPPAAPQAPTRRGRTGAVIAFALMAAAVVVGAALLFLPLRQGTDSAAPSATETPAQTSSTPPQTPTPSPAVTSTTPAPEPVVPPPPVSPEQRVVDTITGYYALIPGDLDSAWVTMTADYQQNHAGGRDNYDAFWAAVAGVQIADVTASAPDQGQATLTYYYRDGSVSQEVTAFRMVDEGGVLKIAASEVLTGVDQ